MEILNAILPVLLYVFGIILLIVLIILGIRMIQVLDKVDRIVDNVEVHFTWAFHSYAICEWRLLFL